MKPTTYLAALTALALLGASCGDRAQEKSVPKTELDPSAGAALLGQGYDSQTHEIRAHCIKFDLTPDEVIYPPTNHSTQTSFKRNLDQESLRALLDVQVNGKLSYGLYNAKGAAQFLNESKSNEYSESLTYYSITRGKSAQLREHKLSELGAQMKNSLESDTIKETCGDEFVRSADLGSMLLYNVKFDFTNEEIKSKFEASIDFDYAAIFSVAGSAKIADDRFTKHLKITIYAMQVGGKTQDLATILSEFDVDVDHGEVSRSAKKDGVNIIDCQLDSEGGVSACQRIMKRMMEYATLDYPSQINQMSYSLQSAGSSNSSNAAALKYHTIKYQNAGVDLYASPVAPLLQAIKDARKRIDVMYQKLSYHLLRAEKLRGMRASKDEQERLENAYKVIKKNHDDLVEVAVLCYEQPNICVERLEGYHPKPYDPEELKLTLRFYDYCVLKDFYSSSVNDSMRIIADALDMKFDDEDCEDIEMDLEAQTQLNLTDTNLRDLRPLAKLDHLKHLYLGKNRILNVAPLSTLSNIEKLVLRENHISNPSPLSRLPRLSYLDLAHNNLFEVDSFKEFEGLKTLKIQGNAIDHFEALEPMSFDLLYRNGYDICETERRYLLETGMINRAVYEMNEQLGFGPLYNHTNHGGVFEGGDVRSDVFTWVNCDALFYLY